MEHTLRAVSIGGGTGQPRAIAALRHMGASYPNLARDTSPVMGSKAHAEMLLAWTSRPMAVT